MTQTDLHPDEELVAEDDAIIGRALRWSLLALVLIAASIGALLFLQSDEEKAEQVIEKQAGEIADMPKAQESLPEVVFTDVTLEAGIDFVHENGATGEKLLPETMGSGAAFFDYDGDGDPDEDHRADHDLTTSIHDALSQSSGSPRMNPSTTGSLAAWISSGVPCHRTRPSWSMAMRSETR